MVVVNNDVPTRSGHNRGNPSLYWFVLMDLFGSGVHLVGDLSTPCCRMSPRCVARQPSACRLMGPGGTPTPLRTTGQQKTEVLSRGPITV